MDNEELTKIPEYFRPFEKFPGADFKDGMLVFPHYSTFLLFAQSVIGILLFCAFCFLIGKSGGAINGFLVGIEVAVYLIIYLICSLQVNIYTAIDYTNNQLFKEFCIFRKTIFTFGYVEIEDILQVSNNVIPQIMNPEGKNNRVKVNKKTNFFHNYVVSFLVNNGDLIDFLELGGYEEYYEVSKNIAKAISLHWGIPLVVCGDSQRLYVTDEEERYHLALEGIPFSYSRSVFIVVCIIIIIAVFSLSCIK